MPAYSYRAKKESAETVVGQVVAQNREDAIELISQMGLLPVLVEEKTAEGGSPRRLRRSVRAKDLYAFSKQLASLLKSGMPILQALDVMSRQTPNRYFAKVIAETSAGVKNGRSMSSCLADYPKVFPPLYVAMVHAGEESANVREMLVELSEYLKAQDELITKVRSAMVYPLFMLGMGIATAFFILTFVLPKITRLFTDMQQALPWPTRVVIGISDALRAGGLWTVVAVLAVILLANRWRQSAPGRMAISRIVLALPFLRNLFLKIDLARFCRTLQLLLRSGLPITQAIEISVPTLSNQLLKREIFACAQGVTAGETLGDCLRKSALMPEMMCHLTTVGEESGTLPEALGDITESFEQEIGEATKVATTLLEPVMILTVGLMIGFIIFAMLMPIFQMDIMAR